MWWLLSSLVVAGDLEVTVDSPDPGHEAIACRLYDISAADGFPGGSSDFEARASVDSDGRPVCAFRDLRPGRYAVAALLDRNHNNALDTSRIGLPAEPWGVSNNVRPTFRAPSFEEAALVVPQEGQVRTTVVLSL